MHVNGTSKGIPGRKRVAHEAKHTEVHVIDTQQNVMKTHFCVRLE